MQEKNSVQLFHEKFEEALRDFRAQEHKFIIGGSRKESRSGKKYSVFSPIDQQTAVGTFFEASPEDVKDAIDSAYLSYLEWKDRPWKDRVEIAVRASRLLVHRKYEFSSYITMENGKTRYESVAEVDETIDYLNYYAQVIQENRGFEFHMEGRIYSNEVPTSVMRPYGVWAVFSPFNFPLAITATMTLGAVLTGNTVVLKPSSDTPVSGFKFAELMEEAGLPPGVINVVTGQGSKVWEVVRRDKRVSGFAFTGSRDVGHRLFREFNELRPRPVVMELGGKNPVIVTEKADIEEAVEGTVRGAFGFGGQKCSATSRAYVHEAVYDLFVEALQRRLTEVVVDDPRKRESFFGPLINEGAVNRYLEAVKAGVAQGGRLLYGGLRIRGLYVEPAVLLGVPRESHLWKTELFAPILLVDRIRDVGEGIGLANDVDYGLTAGIFSKDITEVERFFREIEAGVTYANRKVGATTGAMPGVQPFGGWKSSGFTGRNAGGPYYLLSFMREQSRTYYT